jgi:hypothetical protein
MQRDHQDTRGGRGRADREQDRHPRCPAFGEWEVPRGARRVDREGDQDRDRDQHDRDREQPRRQDPEASHPSSQWEFIYA